MVSALIVADCVTFMPTNPHQKTDPILQVDIPTPIVPFKSHVCKTHRVGSPSLAPGAPAAGVAAAVCMDGGAEARAAGRARRA